MHQKVNCKNEFIDYLLSGFPLESTGNIGGKVELTSLRVTMGCLSAPGPFTFRF